MKMRVLMICYYRPMKLTEDFSRSWRASSFTPITTSIMMLSQMPPQIIFPREFHSLSLALLIWARKLFFSVYVLVESVLMAAEVLLPSTCVVTIWNLAANWFSVIFNVLADDY